MVIDQESLIGTFEQKKKLVSQFNLMDDDFFSVVMENKAACEVVIRTLTGIEDLKVIEVKTQYSIRNLRGHSVILDCYAEDSNHKIHNIEIQVKNNDNQPKRMRYYRTAIDFSIMEKGCSYDELPDVYMIFISAFDMFGLGRSSYESEKRLKNSNYVVDDGVHELYFNTAVDDGTPVSELLQYFKKSDPDNDKFGELSKAVKYQKETEEGVGRMCQAVERYGDERARQAEAKGLAEGKAKGLAEGKAKGLAEGKAKGLAEGKAKGLAEGKAKGLAEGKLQTIKNMLDKGFSLEEALSLTNMNFEEYKKYSSEK